MTTVHETRVRPARRAVPRWVRRTRRVLDVLATGGGIWLTEPQPEKRK